MLGLPLGGQQAVQQLAVAQPSARLVCDHPRQHADALDRAGVGAHWNEAQVGGRVDICVLIDAVFPGDRAVRSEIDVLLGEHLAGEEVAE